MIEQMLMRIAKRGPSMGRLEPQAIKVSLNSFGSPSSSQFPSSQADSPSTYTDMLKKDTQVAWELAKDEHYKRGVPIVQEVPPAYASYTELHAQIASLIWLERKSIRKNIVHICAQNSDVVAELYPSERTVAIRKKLDPAKQGPLFLKELPGSAKPFGASVADQFEYTTAHMLLWYFGQTVPEAVEEIPSLLLASKLQLRKLPLVPPNALLVRHLHLISLFSSGAVNLSALLSHLNKEAAQSLCADLASLYLTGCLVSSQS